MLTWTLRPWQRALIARLEVPHGLIRELRPRPVFLEHAVTSNRFTGLSSQNAHPQSREAFARILTNVRKHATATSTPPRVLICRSPSNSRNVTNRAAMIEALQGARFCCDPAGQAQVRRTGAALRSGEDHRMRVRRRACRTPTSARRIKDRRDHRRGSARSMVLAFLRNAGTRTYRAVPAPVRRGTGQHARHTKDSPFLTRSTSRSWSRPSRRWSEIGANRARFSTGLSLPERRLPRTH